jgi:oligosaccharide repeat unit polymerase
MTFALQTAQRSDPRRFAFDWLLLFVGIAGGGIVVLSAGDDLGMKIVGMAILAFAAAGSVKFDFVHPYVWFGFTFTIYSVSGPLLLHLGIHPYDHWGGYKVDTLDFSGAMDLQFLALAVALAVIGPRRVSFVSSSNSPDIRLLYDGALAVLAAAAILGLTNIVQILSQNFTNKSDVVLSGDWTTRLSFAFNIAATALGVYLAKLFSEKRITLAYLTLVIAVLGGLTVVLLIGQRHFLFRAGLICLLVFHVFHRPIPGRSLILLAVLALVLSTVLGGYKMALVAQEALPGYSGSIWEEGLSLFALRNPEFANQSPFMQYFKVGLVAALGSEAMTPGNNLAMILSRVPADLPFFYGSTIPSDLMRSVLPGFIVQPLIDSTSGEYNRLVFPDTSSSGGGVGFTIAGYGFLHFGTAGLIMVMTVLGVALRASYHWAVRSPLGLMFFLGFFPVAIYIARNDISAPLSQGLKHVLLPLLAMMVISHLKGRRRTPMPRRHGAG